MILNLYVKLRILWKLMILLQWDYRWVKLCCSRLRILLYSKHFKHWVLRWYFGLLISNYENFRYRSKKLTTSFTLENGVKTNHMVMECGLILKDSSMKDTHQMAKELVMLETLEMIGFMKECIKMTNEKDTQSFN